MSSIKKLSKLRIKLVVTYSIMAALALAIPSSPFLRGLIRSVLADTSPQTLPFSQNWANNGMITANDNWSGVPGVEGFLGQDITTATGTDPQTLITTSVVAGDLTVLANQTNTAITNGDVGEFHTTSQAGAPGADSTIALQGSGTADAPYVLLHLNTTGQTGITVAYNLRDIDCTADNAVTPVALQYRVGNSGNFTNVPTGFVADASTGPSLCTAVTPVSVTLPAAVNNQALVQVRVITTNSVGNDEWVGVDDISVTTGVVGDTAPSVSSTSPIDNATGVPVASNISVTFSEPVNAAAGAFSISCASSGAHTFALSGGPTTFTLNPDVDFSPNEICTVTVDDAQVTDVDVNDPPDNMAADFVFDFTTIDTGSCGGPFTAIYAIQGSGTASPIVGASLTTEGVVVGDFQGANNLKGFYIQDPTGDANTATSDGIFVFDGNTPAIDVAVGDRVRVTGTVSEQFNNTQINPAGSIIVCSTGNPVPLPTAVDLPEPVNNDLERFENMLVSFPETLTVTGNFGLGRFGELVLSSDGREFQQNNFDRPNSPGALAVADLNARRYVILDDGLSLQNPDPTPYLGPDNTRRVGDTVAALQGVLTFDFSQYRVEPTVAPVFTSANPRTATPANVNGTVKASSFNVLNYFNGNGAGGGFPTSRGATTLAEFNRQRDKIIAAIVAINADVYGIIELENDGNAATSAIQDLVNGLNAATAAGTYAFREGTTPGTDEIKNSIIYKVSTVTPDGLAVNDTDAIWTGQARNPLAQTFTLNANGAKFVFIVNHFTSKGCSANDTGLDADQGDGQGCDNLQRTLQADALLDFIEERQTTSGEARVLVMGDLNSYGEEDPIFRLEDDATDRLADGPGGLIDLVQRLVPVANRYSYQFGDQSGYLDHALASKELNPYISGTTVWHINADEPTVLDYNVEFKSVAQQAINVGTPYRSSDHDPVIVGINLLLPSAAEGTVTGRITDSNGAPVNGAVVQLSGTQNRKAITDGNGNYRFSGVETSGFYTVTPSRANYTFSPTNRSFSQVGAQTEAAFTGSSTGDSVNPLDISEYFVRQQYLDMLYREPDEQGFNYWSDQINACGPDTNCSSARRRDVAAAFFIEQEMQLTGSFVYGLYKGALARRPLYIEYSADRQQVVGGANLEAKKQSLAESFVRRAEFVQKYGSSSTAESYIDALLQNLRQGSGVDLSGQRASLISRYNSGSSLDQSRSFVVRDLIESASFRQAEYNEAFVLSEYFSYLHRNPDPNGIAFWLTVLNSGDPGNYRGMVCGFINSTEYQRRFSAVVSRSDSECSR
jgi:uncharacterized protein